MNKIILVDCNCGVFSNHQISAKLFRLWQSLTPHYLVWKTNVKRPKLYFHCHQLLCKHISCISICICATGSEWCQRVLGALDKLCVVGWTVPWNVKMRTHSTVKMGDVGKFKNILVTKIADMQKFLERVGGGEGCFQKRIFQESR